MPATCQPAASLHAAQSADAVLPLSSTMLPLQALDASHGAASVQHLEQRSFNAWPGAHCAVVGDWLLRSTSGYTKRANSANALQPGAVLTAPLLRAIEGWYAGQQQPCIFRLSPLADPAADALLQALGYRLQEPSVFLQRSTQRGDALWQPAPGVTVQVDAAPSAAWLQGYSQACGLVLWQQQALARIQQAIGMRCAYVSLGCEGAACAWGLVVWERGAAGLYEVLVAPHRRRQGLGRVLLGAMLQWAQQQGATHTDLQVLSSNQPARQLYASLGFAPVYGYHYRAQPQPA